MIQGSNGRVDGRLQRGSLTIQLLCLTGCVLVPCGALAQDSEQVVLPAGFELVPVSTAVTSEWGQAINSRGQIVWTRRVDPIDPQTDEIFLWDRGRLQRITDDRIRQTYPDINDQGVIVFDEGQPGRNGSDVIRYDHGQREVIAHEEGRYQFSVQINNRGDMVWRYSNDENCGAGTDLMLYSGGSVSPITFDAASHQRTYLGENGVIAWYQYDGCASPQIRAAWVHVPGVGNQQLTDGPDDRISCVSGDGAVLIKRLDPPVLCLWSPESNELVKLVDDGSGVGSAARNDYGVLAYVGVLPGGEGYGALYSCDGQISRMAPDEVGYAYEMDMNCRGEVAIRTIMESYAHNDIWMLRRTSIPGDIDGDRDVDLNDASIVQLCFGKVVADTPECFVSDVSRDGLVDATDIGIVLDHLEGPKQRGDVTYDGRVDLADYFELQRCFDLPSCAHPDCWDADLNQDGLVDGADVLEWVRGVAR